MAQTKPKAGQFYGVSGNGTAGQVLISDGNGGMSWGANTEQFTVSWNTPTGQSLTYTQPNPQSSTNVAGATFPTTTFTATPPSGEEISGTATIVGLPTGITATQSLSGTGANNVLTVTLAGVFPGADSLNTVLTLSGLTVTVPLIVSYLVIAGGGGSGNYESGGGGAGGLRTSYTNSSSLNGHTETSLTLNATTNYTVTVGGGGASHSGSGPGQPGNGTNSVFSTITSTGGGRSGVVNIGNGSQANGGDGGSGGGSAEGGTGGSAVTSPVTQGYDGGDASSLGTSYNDYYEAGGGGGGTNQAGSNFGGSANGAYGGNGGNGLAVNILNTTNAGTALVGEVSGSDVYYAGGGGGGTGSLSSSTVRATGGLGGGGNGFKGQDTITNAKNGTPNTGGGAGGQGAQSTSGSVGGTGGSGVVILRYPSSYTVSGLTEATGSPFTEGTSKVSVFTSGTGNIQFN